MSFLVTNPNISMRLPQMNSEALDTTGRTPSNKKYAKTGTSGSGYKLKHDLQWKLLLRTKPPTLFSLNFAIYAILKKKSRNLVLA